MNIITVVFEHGTADFIFDNTVAYEGAIAALGMALAGSPDPVVMRESALVATYRPSEIHGFVTYDPDDPQHLRNIARLAVIRAEFADHENRAIEDARASRTKMGIGS